jgi:hypothetical protein
MIATFYTIYCALNRRAELERLVAWATRKRLPGPRRLYRSRLLAEEQRVARYGRRFPRLAAWAAVAHRLYVCLTPRPRHPSRGAAVGYRFLTRRPSLCIQSSPAGATHTAEG